MPDRIRPREPPPSDSHVIICLRVAERLLSLLLVLVLLWRTLCGGP